jgi:hypothetical protein
MDREAPRSDAPGEYQDVYHRPVVIDLDAGLELPLNLRVQVRIEVSTTPVAASAESVTGGSTTSGRPRRTGPPAAGRDLLDKPAQNG